jgi:hypothetical protein
MNCPWYWAFYPHSPSLSWPFGPVHKALIALMTEKEYLPWMSEKPNVVQSTLHAFGIKWLEV